jgi:hypothetical protein
VGISVELATTRRELYRILADGDPETPGKG